MSVTPSGLSERFPIRRLPRQGSILNKDLSPDKKHDKKNSEKSPLYEFDPTESSSKQKKPRFNCDEHKHGSYGLVQRCVIIQRDENGFGLTVSGDNPVFVQSVKEDGAAVRAGVQQGDRIIKVNGTLVTHSNHVEVVRLIKSGSYVALTVLGRPPGSPQVPLTSTDGDAGGFFFPGQQSQMSPNPTFSHHSSSSSCPERITSPMPVAEDNIVHNQKVEILRNMLGTELRQLEQLKEKYSRNPSPQLLRDQQEVEKHIQQLQEQLGKATGSLQDGSTSVRHSEALAIVERLTEDAGDWEHDLPSQSENTGSDRSRVSFSRAESTISSPSPPCDGLFHRDSLNSSPKISPKDAGSFCESMEVDENQDWDSLSSGLSPPRVAVQIIGAEDDDFDTEAEQIDVQCSCFQSIDLVKSRPAHLVAFLHHVVSQFEAAPLLCYLYADLYNHTNSKDHRRMFLEFCHLFLEKGSNLRVQVPEWISVELERRKGDLSEEMQRSCVQGMQDSVLPDVQTHLEDFRQKRNMGMTIGENELAKLDAERIRDRVAAEQKERVCAEHLLQKIDEVLATLSPSEEEKSNSVADVILLYMKQLGVKMKELRNLDRDRRLRVAFFPKKKPSIKKEKETVKDDEKKKRFQSILDPIRRTSKQDRNAIEKAKLLHQRQMGPYIRSASHSDHSERSKSIQFFSEGSEASYQPVVIGSPGAATASTVHDGISECDTDSAFATPATFKMLTDNSLIGDSSISTPKSAFELPSTLDQVMEEDRESEKSLETATPPCTPKPGRRADGHGYGAWTEAGSQTHPLSQTEEDQMHLSDVEQDPANWQQLVSRDVLSGLKPHEIKRQEVINELFHTERAHIRMLKVLDVIFYQKMMRDGSIPTTDVRNIFSNLEEVLQLHVSLNEQMRKVWKRNENFVVDQIGEDLLSWFSCSEEEKFKRAAATFCSNQPFALELIKSKQKKDSRFQAIIQEAQSNPQCRRLQLKDIIPTEMQRLTKYPLLLENIAKNTDPEQHEEKKKVKQAAECCRQILNFVNQAVKEAENKQRLEDYQRRLDLSSLKQSDYPLIEEFRNLDLTKRIMIHEGPLTWRVNKDKTIDLYTLLLEDILVLSQKQDERLVLKCHSKNLAANADTKHTFSPIIKLSAVLVREVATDNKAFFVISTSADGAQIYELVAQTVSERKTWQYLITQTSGSIKAPSHHVAPEPPTESEQEDEENLSTIQPGGSSKVPGRMSSSGDSTQGKEIDDPLAVNISASNKQKHSAIISAQETEGQPRYIQDFNSLRRPTAGRPPYRSTELHYSSQARSSVSSFPYSRAESALINLHSLKQLLSVQMLGSEDDASDGASIQHLPEEDSLSLKQGTDGPSDSTTCCQGETPNKALQHQLEIANGTLEEVEAETRVSERTKLSRQLTLEAGHERITTEGHGPDSVADDGGDRFYDAPEDHSDEHRSQGNSPSPNREEEAKSQARASGNFLTLDDFPQTEGSSTDEIDMSTIPPDYSVDCITQSTEARESNSTTDPCNTEGSEAGIRQLLPSSHVRNQILQFIHSIESDLKYLKEVELECYSQHVLESTASHEPTGDS
ncbi:rho guanine nucleotide exchange factor 12-like isoform X3 [Pristis pectinata]|uniref:rho guanine nucleotide exchange factor 12-like isoform X3 n=1 Tax=Pristis pectinata TaxID=685728 RepID=UPI00223D9429|nr:rho guanine nucleotide exchange factor 12-like isoform X3 [Pristis pectinata]